MTHNEVAPSQVEAEEEENAPAVAYAVMSLLAIVVGTVFAQALAFGF